MKNKRRIQVCWIQKPRLKVASESLPKCTTLSLVHLFDYFCGWKQFRTHYFIGFHNYPDVRYRGYYLCLREVFWRPHRWEPPLDLRSSGSKVPNSKHQMKAGKSGMSLQYLWGHPSPRWNAVPSHLCSFLICRAPPWAISPAAGTQDFTRRSTNAMAYSSQECFHVVKEVSLNPKESWLGWVLGSLTSASYLPVTGIRVPHPPGWLGRSSSSHTWKLVRVKKCVISTFMW